MLLLCQWSKESTDAISDWIPPLKKTTTNQLQYWQNWDWRNLELPHFVCSVCSSILTHHDAGIFSNGFLFCVSPLCSEGAIVFCETGRENRCQISTGDQCTDTKVGKLVSASLQQLAVCSEYVCVCARVNVCVCVCVCHVLSATAVCISRMLVKCWV